MSTIGRSRGADFVEAPNNENSTPAKPFRGTLYYNTLKEHLVDIFSKGMNAQVSGNELFGIVVEFIDDHSGEYKSKYTDGESAMRLVGLLLREGFIQYADGSGCTDFNDSRRVFYRLGRPDEQRGILMMKQHESPARCSIASVGKGTIRDRSRERPTVSVTGSGSTASSTQRKLSFSSILGGVGNKLLRRNSSARRSGRRMVDENLHEEARLFEAALARFLALVDIPTLEGILDVQDECTSGGGSMQDPRSTISLLSFFLSKMGLCSEDDSSITTADLDCQAEYLLKRNRRAGLVPRFFAAARALCPRLRIDGDNTLDDDNQLNVWARHCLETARQRLDAVTKSGASPLIPRELTPALTAIVPLAEEKKRRALAYLVTMVPSRARSELIKALTFLTECRGTNLVFSLCGADCEKLSYAQRSKIAVDENLHHACEALRQFVLPREGIEPAYVKHLFEELIPALPLIKRTVEELTRDCERVDSPLPVQFCDTTAATSATSSADEQLADLLAALLVETQMTDKERLLKTQQFQSVHPAAYKIYLNRTRHF